MGGETGMVLDSLYNIQYASVLGNISIFWKYRDILFESI